MHELSIAIGLVEAACDEARRLGGVRVEVLHVRVGALAGVVPEALRFAFEMAAAGTPIAGAALAIEEVPAAVFCPDCGAEGDLPSIQLFRCPVCGAITGDVIRGRELALVALEIDDDVPDHVCDNGSEDR